MNSVRNTNDPPQGISALATNGTTMMLASVIFFSASIVLIKLIYIQYGLSFWVITLPRFVTGLLLVKFLFSGEQRVIWGDLVSSPWMVARGVIGGLGVIAYNLCIGEIGAGRTSIITSTYPIFGILLAPLFLPEVLSGRILALSIVSISGVVLMTGYGVLFSEPSPFDLLAILVAVASGVVIVAIRKLHNCSNTATIFASQCAYGIVFCLPGAIWSFEGISLAATLLTLGTAVSVALGQLFLTQSFKTLSVARGSSLQLLAPPVIVLASYLFLGEVIGVSEIVGGGIILTSSLLIAKSRQ